VAFETISPRSGVDVRRIKLGARPSNRRVNATDRLAINVLEAELDAAASFCRAQSLGIEITAFASPDTLGVGYHEAIKRHAAEVTGIIDCRRTGD